MSNAQHRRAWQVGIMGTDLFAVIMLLLIVVAVAFYARLQMMPDYNVQEAIRELVRVIAVLDKNVEAHSGHSEKKPLSAADIQKLAADLREIIEKLKDKKPEEKEEKRKDQPPSITLADEAGFRFPSGSYDPSGFIHELNDVGEKIGKLVDLYEVNTVVVIGHTDEQPGRSNGSNLDQSLIQFLSGVSVKLQPTDNVGLGMARAAAVAKILREYPKLHGMKFQILSAGQTLLPDGTLSNGSPGDDRSRRRIEIRLTKTG